MNIHPALVHFPIALLTFYSIFECLRFRKLIENREWFYVKASFLFLGGLGALAALETGDFGRSLYPAARAIISVHEHFADITVAVFGIIALIYLGIFIDYLFGAYIRNSSYAKAWGYIIDIEKRLSRGYVLIPLALIGFLSLFITGALGASVVYGVASDPFTQIVNRLFVR